MHRSSSVALAMLLGTVAVTATGETKRWYTQAQVEQGRALYRAHCAGCHGEAAQGAADWKRKGADGRYPPPPLNGTGHAWHHPLSQLKRTIDRGGVPLGGWMPAFEGRFTDADKDALIAYIQSHWPDEVYSAWLQRGGLR